MNKVISLAAIVLAVAVGAAGIPALAQQPNMTRQAPGTSMGQDGMGQGGMGQGGMGQGGMDMGGMDMGGMGHGMMGRGMMGMMGGMMAGGCDGMMQPMNSGRPNSQWRAPQSGPGGMPD